MIYDLDARIGRLFVHICTYIYTLYMDIYIYTPVMYQQLHAAAACALNAELVKKPEVVVDRIRPVQVGRSRFRL